MHKSLKFAERARFVLLCGSPPIPPSGLAPPLERGAALKKEGRLRAPSEEAKCSS